jgi:hypothetical protein
MLRSLSPSLIMGAVGITHHLEHFAIFTNSLIRLSVWIMYIVISRAVNEQ